MKRGREYQTLGSVRRVRASRPRHAPSAVRRQKAGGQGQTAPGLDHAVIPPIDELPGRPPAPEAVTNPHRFVATPGSRRQASFRVEQAEEMFGGMPGLDLGDDLFSWVASRINLGLRIVVTPGTGEGAELSAEGQGEVVDKRADGESDENLVAHQAAEENKQPKKSDDGEE